MQRTSRGVKKTAGTSKDGKFNRADFVFGYYHLYTLETLGSGYAGSVLRVKTHDGSELALKLGPSKDSGFPFNTEPLLVEYRKQMQLYASHVPVPRPLGFFTFADSHGLSQSGFLMELVSGGTLRDWLNKQPGEMDSLTSRSLHPVLTPKDGLTRLDLAIDIIDALIRLQHYGAFVDLKPRNIVIDDTGRSVRAKLIDTGGIIMFSDVPPATQSRMLLKPSKHRSLVETTSSYLCPEYATLVVESELTRRLNHFPYIPGDPYNLTPADVYKKLRSRLLDVNILTGADEVEVSDRSTVFIMGLVLVEMFGGRRTGLTSLTRLLRESHFATVDGANLEFRVVLDWDTYQDHYREKCYPREGLFGRCCSPSNEFARMWAKIADACLTFRPRTRPSLSRVKQDLQNLRREVKKRVSSSDECSSNAENVEVSIA